MLMCNKMEEGLSGRAWVGVYPYKEVLIGYIVVRYIIMQYVNYRQLKRTLVTDIPREVAALGTTYQQFLLSQAYATDKLTFEMLCLSIMTCLQCLLLMANVRVFIWGFLQGVFPRGPPEEQSFREFQRAYGYILILLFIAKAFMVPLEAYQMEIIDKKHKRVSRSLQDYLGDLVVDGIITVVFMLPVLYGYLRLVQQGGDRFYFFLLILTLVATIIYVQVYPYMTIFFNKFKPVADPELLAQIGNLALKAHFPAEEIRIKVNGEYDEHGAQYRGIGTKHCIAVYESLLGKLSTREVGGVICHQLGHWHHRHSLKTLLLTLGPKHRRLLPLQLLPQQLGNLSEFRLPAQVSTSSLIQVFIGTALFYELHSPIVAVFSLLTLVVRRYFEFQSDSYAVRLGYGQELRQSLVKLYKDSAPKIRPDAMYAWVNYSHPSLWERIENIDRLIEKQEQQMAAWLRRSE